MNQKPERDEGGIGAPEGGYDVVEAKPIKQMKCEDIQPMILAYFNHELGDAFSMLVREHIRKCPACKASAAEIKATVLALKKADGNASANPRLTDERRQKILHEVMDGHSYEWIYKGLFAFAVIIVVWGAYSMLCEIYGWNREPPDPEVEALFEVSVPAVDPRIALSNNAAAAVSSNAPAPAGAAEQPKP